jgi:GT2 family glycosyltransferase
VLYHWRMTPGSTATTSSAKPKSWDAGQRALSESLVRRRIDASAESGPYPNTFRVRRPIVGQPLVSILVPFRDKPELLSTCIESILEKTDYPHFEVVGIDNGSSDPATHALMRTLERRDSRIRFVAYEAPFNYSSINNFGARHARGEHLLLLNNDTEIIEAPWLRALLEHSQRPEVGVVGAKLLYSDSRIQHAGVIVGIGGVAGHAHLLQPCDHPGYFSRAQLQQNLSAVTFACAMTRREVFEQLGGLNESDLAIAFNDIDYCLRAREAGYLVVYTPYAMLYHHESKTRGYEDNPEKQARFFREITYMQARHAAILLQGDPYYNPNLRLDTHDFSAYPGYVDALPH